MRLVLRNQSKIQEAYGKKVLDRILKSIEVYQSKNTKLEPEYINGEKYPIIDINDEGHTCGVIILYVISQKYDVITLAFIEIAT